MPPMARLNELSIWFSSLKILIFMSIIEQRMVSVYQKFAAAEKKIGLTAAGADTGIIRISLVSYICDMASTLPGCKRRHHRVFAAGGISFVCPAFRKIIHEQPAAANSVIQKLCHTPFAPRKRLNTKAPGRITRI